MRGDETQRGVAPGAESREIKGPRHAAPRKSLLTKFQIPVGKTMALAAMPTAVFVGMGMAPKLAVADDKEIPFAPGPCVTRSDEPTESASPSPSKTPSPSSSPTATPSPSASKSAKPKPSASPTATKPAADKPTAEKPEADKQTAPAPAPTASKSTNPLDPLGVGDKLKGIVDDITQPLKDAQTTATPTPAPSTSAPTAPKPDPAADAIRDAAKKAGVDVKELSDEVKGTEKTPKDETGKTSDKDADKDEDKAKPEETKDADGKEPFPCPTYDAKALADAELEQDVPLLPDEPWYLDSSLLTLYGLDYHGIVEVKTAGGKTKKVLKFTADSLDIKDLYQTVGTKGNVAHLKSRPGSTSKIRGGTVTMYTESLKGNLFGLIPIEFTPNSPPPLDVPFAFFTNVKVVQAGQFGGTLTVPGLKNYIGPPE
uniref:Hydrogenase expression protein HypF n=1 Tax=Streptomyces sp. NBC_00049 TaxID=2903617 RepID=A0AAU2JTN8_9ACTN